MTTINCKKVEDNNDAFLGCILLGREKREVLGGLISSTMLLTTALIKILHCNELQISMGMSMGTYGRTKPIEQYTGTNKEKIVDLVRFNLCSLSC